MALIKQVILFLSGLVTAFGSVITGLGAQAAYAPMLTWMLGFSHEKAQSTAMRFACFTATSGVIGACLAHAEPPSFWRRGVVLFLGALLGAILGAPVARLTQAISWRRWFLSAGIALALLVVMRTSKLSSFDIPYVAQWQTPGQLFLLGLIAGGLTQALGLPSGLLMVSGLYYVGAFTPSESITLSLLVIALASLMPAIAYTRRGVVDRNYTLSILTAAIIGGLLAGRLLPPDHGHLFLSHRILIVISAAIAMFLCGRELARLTFNATAPPPNKDSI